MFKAVRSLVVVAAICFFALSLIAAPAAFSVAIPSGSAPGESSSDILSNGEKPAGIDVVSSCGTALTLFFPIVYACIIANSQDYIQHRPKVALCASAALFDAFLMLPCICNLCLSSGGSCPACNKAF